MKFGKLMPARALTAAALAASVSFASLGASAASIVLNQPADGSTVNVYTAGGALPASINRPASATAGLDTIAVTFFVQGGSLVNDGTTTDGVNWTGVVNLADGANSTSYTATVEAMAESEGYYAQADFASDTADVTVNVFDSASVDGDGDGTPDADQVLNVVPNGGDTATFSGTGQSGNAISTSIGNISGASGATLDGVVIVGGYYGNGDTVNFSVTVPSLNDLQAAFPGDPLLTGATNAVVMLTFATDSGDLTTDADDDPASSLGGAIPAFMRLVILVEISANNWSAFTETLPASAAVEGTVTFNVAASVTRVQQYFYGVDFSQNGNNFEFANSGSGWTKDEDTNAAPAASSRAISISGNTIDSDFVHPSSIYGWVLSTGGNGGGDDDDSTCFIATAAYGTPMATEINTLREVRDSYLLNNVVGSAFVDTYYRLSPAVADKVAESPALAAVVRAALTPFILLGKIILAAPMAVVAFLMAGAGLVLAHRKARSQQS